MDLTDKLRILSDATKYDVSCSSSGSNRSSKNGQLDSISTSGIYIHLLQMEDVFHF